jgi:hypothetical protein
LKSGTLDSDFPHFIGADMTCLTPTLNLKSRPGNINSSDFSDAEYFLQLGDFLHAKNMYSVLQDMAFECGNEIAANAATLGIARAVLQMGDTDAATRITTQLASSGMDENSSMFQLVNQILVITNNRVAQAQFQKTSNNSPFASTAIERANWGIELARYYGNLVGEMDLQTNLLFSMSLLPHSSGRSNVDYPELIVKMVELHGRARAQTPRVRSNSLTRLLIVGRWAGHIGLTFRAFKEMAGGLEFVEGRKAMLIPERLNLAVAKQWHEAFYIASNGSRVRKDDKGRALLSSAGFLMRDFSEELRAFARDVLSEMALWCHFHQMQLPGLAQLLRNRIVDLQIATGEKAVLHLLRA